MKENIKNRLLSFALVTCLLISIFGLSACGTRSDTNTNFVIDTTANGKTLLTLSQDGGYQTRLTIPEGVECIAVNAFLPAAFSLVEVTIPSSVKLIQENAFAGCINLAKINFADGSQLETIEEKAFYSCGSLTEINLPTGLKTLGEKSFNQCKKLTAIEIPSSVETVGARAFSECTSLESATIKSKQVGEEVFYLCNKLSNVILEEGLLDIGPRLLYNCSKITSLIIPSSVIYIRGPFNANNTMTFYVKGHTQAPSTWNNSWYYPAAIDNVVWNA